MSIIIIPLFRLCVAWRVILRLIYLNVFHILCEIWEFYMKTSSTLTIVTSPKLRNSCPVTIQFSELPGLGILGFPANIHNTLFGDLLPCLARGDPEINTKCVFSFQIFPSSQCFNSNISHLRGILNSLCLLITQSSIKTCENKPSTRCTDLAISSRCLP